jgi:hypothetical protein
MLDGSEPNPCIAAVKQELRGLQAKFSQLYSETTTPSPDSSKHFNRAEAWRQRELEFRQICKEHLNREKFNSLAHMLDLCTKHSIRTLVVGTPLAPSLKKLAFAFPLQEYHQTMLETVNSSHCDGFIDLSQSPDFIEDFDFLDQVHVNGGGCRKMLRRLTPVISHILNDKTQKESQ